MPGITFLKLGGSLITDKTRAHTAQLEVLDRLAGEIAAARAEKPGWQLILGHGSGSFGHVPARRFGTRQGVRTPNEWAGFVEVWQEAAALNQLVMAALRRADLPVMLFPPSSAAIARGGKLESWHLEPLQAAVRAGLIPVVHGDVVFDQEWGGTILSTEDLFCHLAAYLRPEWVLLAGREDGVWADYPTCTRLYQEITPQDWPVIAGGMSGSHGADVTGGMASKVQQMLDLVEQLPGLEVVIFSGMAPGAVQRVLKGEVQGTRLHASDPARNNAR